MKRFRIAIQFSAALLLTAFTLSLACTAQAQANSQVKIVKAPTSKTNINVLASAFHATPTTFAGAKQKLAPINAKGARGAAVAKSDPALTSNSAPGPKTAVPSGTHFYPADLVNYGGPTSTSATFYNIYVNIGGAGDIAPNWGNPNGFLYDLGKSSFIHLTDQYTGNNALTQPYGIAGIQYILEDSYTGIATDSDIQQWAYDLAQVSGGGPGLNNIYHFYFTQGTDVCFDSTDTVCYSPDNPSSWYFCAYHGAVNIDGYGTILYTVEPFQDIPGCQVQTPSPNGQLADSTNSVLSHETFETITDPLPGYGWVNGTSLDLSGYEIGDECQALSSSTGAMDPTFYINGHQYEVQLEYSNYYHGCTMQPKNSVVF